MTSIQLPVIGDIAPGGVVDTCLADAERLLSDQGMEPPALNWLAVCDHFLRLPLLSVARRDAFRLLLQSLERVALASVKIDTCPAPLKISQGADRMTAPARIGQRVRFTRTDHPHVPLGSGGMIDQLGTHNQFFVLTNCGGSYGWTTFDSWEPTGEPDVVLNPEYVAMRTQALCDDSSIKAVP